MIELDDGISMLATGFVRSVVERAIRGAIDALQPGSARGGGIQC